MSVVTPASFDPTLTDAEVWNLVNNLPVNYQLFSQMSHYWARMYGVLTGERSEQGHDDVSGAGWHDFTVNLCLRDALWSLLRSNGDAMEYHVGYNTSTRFHKHTINWNSNWNWYGGQHRTWPGIESVDVTPAWSDLVGYDAVTVSPFVRTNITMVAGPPDIATIPESVADNPYEIILRRATDNGTFSIDYRQNVPFRDGLGNWKLAIENQPIAWNGVDQINAQDTRYVFVDIEPPVCEGTVYPVYPGTNQIIPQAKPRQTVGGLHRYWFWIYTLVAPPFYNNVTDLVSAEYLKLLPTIAFKCYTEQAQPALLTKTCRCPDGNDCGCEDQCYYVSTKVINPELGLVSFCVEGLLVDSDDDGVLDTLDPTKRDVQDDGVSAYKLTYYYKTNPEFLNEKYRKFIPELRRALLHKTAADLPVQDCGCTVKRGFIARQQESFGKVTINPLTGATAEQFQYGDMRGQRTYGEIISNAPLFKFVNM